MTTGRRAGMVPRPTPRPDAPRTSRALTSAPCSTSFSANWRLVRVPDPLGAGSPLSSSPRFGLRTQVSVWSAVKPDRWSFGSAPASSNSTASAKWPFSTARIKGLVPRAGARPDVFFGCMASLTSAPASSRTRTTSARPSRTAKNNGVKPEGNGVRKSAPARKSAFTTSACP